VLLVSSEVGQTLTLFPGASVTVAVAGAVATHAARCGPPPTFTEAERYRMRDTHIHTSTFMDAYTDKDTHTHTYTYIHTYIHVPLGRIAAVGSRMLADGRNLCVDHERGDPSATVLVVASLDSSVAGPGINRPGSGAATALALALGLQVMGLETTNRCAHRHALLQDRTRARFADRLAAATTPVG
jgi:hypothetical protein